MTSYQRICSFINNYPQTFWVVIGATVVNQVGNMARVFLMLYLTIHLGFTLPQTSFVFAAFGIGLLLSGFIGGILIDRFGAGQTMIFAILANGLVLLAILLFNHYLSILILCLLWGFLYALYRPAAQTLVSFLAPPGTYKITFSIFRLAMNFGMSLGPSVGGYLATRSFSLIFIINGVINIVTGIILIIGLRGSSWLKIHSQLSKQKMQSSIQWLKYDAALRFFFFGMIPVSMVFFQNSSTFGVFLNSNLHFPMIFYGLLFMLNTVLIVLFELPLNIITLSWPPRISLIVGTLFTTLGFGGLMFATLKWQVILLTIFWTIGEMVLFPAATAYIAELAPEKHRGSYMSIYNLSMNIGLFLGPWAGALIMHRFSARGLWLFCGAWGLISALAFIFMSTEKKLPLLKVQEEL